MLRDFSKHRHPQQAGPLGPGFPASDPGLKARLVGRTLSWLLLIIISFSVSRAQNVDPQSLFGRDTTQSVYVHDSAVAVEKFALAERMEHLRQWDKSADVYQEIAKGYADRVIPSQTDNDNKIYQFASVIPAVQERLAKWPAEGLAVYRTRYEGEAAALLESAHDDPPLLQRVYSLYFITDAAKSAGMRLIDIDLERGEFPAAAWIGDRLLNWHPNLGDDRAKILYRTALADHLSENDAQAQQRLKELKEKFPQATATVRGGDVVLADSLSKELSIAQAKPREYASDSWPMPFGSPDRSRVPPISGFGGAHLVSIEVPRLSIRNIAFAQRRELDSQIQRDVAAGATTGIFPVVDRGELFFQDNARIYAMNLESDEPLPGWAQTYDGERKGRYSINAWPMPQSQQCTLAVTDDSVLAIMGQPDLLALQFTGTFGQRDTRLVCLDRKDGKEKWVVFPKQLPESAANLRDLDFLGCPLIVGDTVFIQARGAKGAQFEDFYVLAFDLSSGKFKWACYLASANSGAQFWDNDMSGVMGQAVSQLAYADGRVYALTNLGALASVDAYDGTIVWLNVYPREMPDHNNMGFGWNRFRAVQAAAPEKPWVYNPVIVSQGKVFILPSDGQSVHIYDAGSGVEIKRIKLSQFNNAQTMLGVVDEKLILNDAHQVYCIDWQNYDPAKSSDDNLVWKTSTFQRAGVADDFDSIRGRGFVTADSVLIPTAWQLYRLSLRSGSIQQSYPPGNDAAWAEDEGAGNVLMTQDRLIIAGPTLGNSMRVNVYTDLTMAMQKLDAAVAAAPADPSIRLKYARIMFSAGKPDAAVAKLDEAIKLTNASGASRDPIFVAAMDFAQKLAKEHLNETADLTNGLFDRAGAAATSASQNVNYRLSRAEYAKDRQLPAAEVQLYQQILTDESLRSVAVPDSDGNTVTASLLARRAIDDAIRTAGPAVYAEFEKAADQMLDDAGKTLSPDQLQAIAQVYPNSSAAPKALLAAADLYESNSNPRRATQVLRQLYIRYPQSADRATVIEAMARNYLLMPNRVDVAVARLNQGAKLLGPAKLSKPLVLPDGRRIENVTFAEAATMLKQYGAAAMSAELPDVAMPDRAGDQPPPFLAETADSVVAGVASLLTPEPEFARNDRVVTFTSGAGLRVFAIGGTQPVMSSDAITQTPTGLAWIGHSLCVWTDSDIYYFAADSGQLLWSNSLKTIPPIDVITQSSTEEQNDGDQADNAQQQNQQPPPGIFPQNRIRVFAGGQRVIIQPGGRMVVVGAPQQPIELPAKPATEQIAQVCPLMDRLIVGTTDGRIIALDLDGGKLLWQTRLSDRSPTNLLASDDFVAMRLTEDNGSTQLCVLDTFSGQMLTRRIFSINNEDSGGMAPVNLALASDGTLVYLMPDRVCGKDLFEPGGLEKLTFESAGRIEGDMPFQTSLGPDELRIAEDRIIAVADGGQTVRIYSLHDGSLLRFNQGDAILRTNSPANSRLWLRVAGAQIYVATQREMRGFDAEHGMTWSSLFSTRTATDVRDLVVAREHVLAITEPAAPRMRRATDEPMPFLQLKAFSRATDANGIESGLLEHDVNLSANAPIVAWQVVDGGFYYLGSDQELHFLRGARDEKPKG